MSKEDATPFRTWTAHRKSPINYEQYHRHCEPLNIKASGTVMVIGPSLVGFEELALIEEDVANKSVKKIVLIGENPAQYKIFTDGFRRHHPEILMDEEHINSYSLYFMTNPSAKFDTILFIGIPLQQPRDTISYLSDHLNSQGNIFMTTCSFDPPVIEPIKGITVNIGPNPLPPHPYYSVGYYYGIVVKKT